MGTPALATDYLFVGPLIVARLREQVAVLPGEADVMLIEQLAQAGADRGTRSPLAFVLWDGERMALGDDGKARQGRSQGVVQAWAVLLHVRNASQVDTAARNTAAGPVMAAIHQALAGWTPEGCARPLMRANGRAKPNYDANSGLYPLTFEILLNL